MCLIKPLIHSCYMGMLKRIAIGLLMITFTLTITTIYSGLMFVSYQYNNGTLCFSNDTVYGDLPDVLNLEIAVSVILIIALMV